MPTLHPVGTMILIETQVASDKTPGGIIIPDTAKEKPAKGKVLQIPVKLETEIKVGSVIFFPPNALRQFVIDDQTFSAVAEENIFCYYDNGEKSSL
jgi:chaperonin GroES